MDWRSHIARYGQAWFPGERWVRITAVLLLLLAAVLRFYRLHELPFTHDELSALVRLYPTLGETLQRGVIELDTHPPGVQVFEWLWTQAFGMSEFAVKLPFVLMSLTALFLLYRFALAWTSAPTALLTTTLLATLQFSVMYGQIARPYAAGFFTVALLADQLARYLAFNRHSALIGTGIAALLCAYAHHFTLMLAGIIVLTGVLLLRPDQRKGYLVMCVLTALFYLPNIPILLKQLGMGGLDGWLTAPDAGWLVDHVRWLVHFSPLLGGVLLLLLGWSLVRRFRQREVATPASLFLPIWGLLSLVIGFAYSIWRSPVLQYSMLLFSFAFVLMALFAGLRVLSRNATVLVCITVAIVAVSTLIVQRQHYRVFYTSRYEAMMEKAIEIMGTHGSQHALAIFDAPAPQVEFYAERYGLRERGIPFVNLRGTITPGGLDSLLVAARPEIAVLGISNGAENEDIARVQARLPYLLEQQDHVEGQVFVLGKNPSSEKYEDRTLIDEIRPGQSSHGPFHISGDLPMVRDSVGNVWWAFHGREFGLECTLDLTTEGPGADDLYEVVADVSGPASHTDLAVIMELNTDGQNLLYKGGDLNSYGAGRITLVVTASPSWVKAPGSTIQLKAYIFNRAKGDVHLSRLALYRRPANPVGNALFEPITSLGYRPK